jgi:tripartite-type tricarboxylate transporter receptor subunit TctC
VNLCRATRRASYTGLGVPRNTPTEIVEKLNKEIDAAVADPKLKARFAELGGVPMPMPPPEYRKFLADDTKKWAKVVKFANIKPE